MNTPATNNVVNANVTAIHPAMSTSIMPTAANAKGVIVTAHDSKGVAKLIIVASMIVYFAVFSMFVSLRLVNNAFSKSVIRFPVQDFPPHKHLPQ